MVARAISWSSEVTSWGCPTSTAIPATPSATPKKARPGGRSFITIQTSSSTSRGSKLTSSAAIPVSTHCCAQTITPTPTVRNNTPSSTPLAHCRAVMVIFSPLAQAINHSSTPAMTKRTPVMPKGGRLSMAQ